MQKLYLLLFVSSFCLSCSKKSTAPDRVAQQTQLLTSGVWQLADRHYGPYETMQACNQDDQLRFLTNGGGQQLQGPVKCNPSDPDSVSIAWSFNDKDAYILQINTTEYNVTYLDEHLLKYETRNVPLWYSPNIYVYTK